jgi:Fe-Mn family superoxide dismutase
MKFTLEKLPYEFNALEPVMDAATVEIHYTKHHNGYVNNLNAALEKYPEINYSLEELLKNIKTLPQDIQSAVKNSGGGHYNHAHFWKVLTPNSAKAPTGELSDKINQTFGSFEEFKKEFVTAGTKHFGSGWVWLLKDREGELSILTLPNQDAPVIYGTGLLGIDLWEHAYYLKHQNRRADYLNNIWEIINWEYVQELYEKS